jgi:hypothetical protein
MTQEQNAKLLQAYRAAIAAGQDGIADALEDVILEKMDEARLSPIFIGESRTTTDSPWKVTYGPDTVPLDAKMTCTGIDHLSKETTA